MEQKQEKLYALLNEKLEHTEEISDEEILVEIDKLDVYKRQGMLYKCFIKTKDGRGLYKADPFANYAEQRPGTASRITDITKLRWSDAAWMEARKQRDNDSLPVSIYEVHPGSWKKHPHGEDEDGFYNYREFAKSLAEYVKEMGYTHVELMGIAERCV